MKEQDKVLIAKLILKITIIMTFVSVAIKLMGFNLFDADYENAILQGLTNFILNFKVIQLKTIINFAFLFIQAIVFIELSCKKKTMRNIMIVATLQTFSILMVQYYLNSTIYLNPLLYNLISFSILTFPAILINILNSRTIKVKQITQPIITYFLLFFYQLISIFIRNLNLNDKYDLLYNFLLNFDYIILLLLSSYLSIKNKIKHNFNIYNMSFLKFINKFPDKNEIEIIVTNIKKQIKSFKKQSKTNKIIFVLYIFFFIIQELITLGILLFVATLNDYMIECLFILTSFIISKKVFGAFHFKSFILCFFVSNTSFFILSKLTINVNVTFVIPITLGILLSYISSRFIKKTDNTPYRGMPKDDLQKVCKNKDLNKLETDILIDYYSNRYNLEKLSIKYSYSDRSIQRIKSKALKKVYS